MVMSSKIYLRNRSIGYVSNHVPCVIRYSKKREDYLVSTCVGKAFHTYNLKHLTLLSVSDTVEEDISCMVTDSLFFYTASGKTIHAWKRNAIVKYTYNGHEEDVHLLLPFGEHLISVDEGNNLNVWAYKSQEIVFSLNLNAAIFRITAVEHPKTHINRILLGSEQGQMQLWNIKTSKLIHTFKGWDACITVLEQAPALDVMGVGLSDGRIMLHNIRCDKTLISFNQEWGSVTSISFRTDGEHIMASGSNAGHVVLWNLEERNVSSQILNGHNGSVSSAICIPGEPLLVTSSTDNSLKVWIFDQPEAGGRLLRHREGHSACPTFVRFYGPTSNHILSAGGDSSLRVFNTISESLNYSLGKASYNRAKTKKKKGNYENLTLPPILDFDFSLYRKEWDNIAAVHQDCHLVTTWNYEKRKMGSHKLCPERLEYITRAVLGERATCLHVTNCGNFVVVGYSSGHVDRFNMQSGLQRASYGGSERGAHKGAIRGVAVDNFNQRVVSACSRGYVKVWPFAPPNRGSLLCPQPVAVVPLAEPVSFIRLHPECPLIAIVHEDFVISLLDVETRTIIRKFSGHTGQITDVGFSPDAKWLISASMDCTIRTWNVPHASLIDIFKVEAPCSSLAMSWTGQYLVTAHVGHVGLYLWSNRTLFSHVSLRRLPEGEQVPCLPLPASAAQETILAAESAPEEEDLSPPSDQIDHLLTLSGLPASRWRNLLHLDIIRKRNKPKEPPKVPQNAPFFLPTLPGKDIVFAVKEDSNGDGKLVKLNSLLKNYTSFGQLLDETSITHNYSVVVDRLKGMSPSGIDFEIHSLGLAAQGSLLLLSNFLNTIIWMLSSNIDFDLAQSYLGVFVKAHGETLTQNHDLTLLLEKIQTYFDVVWDQLESDLNYCLSVTTFLKE